MKRLKSIDEILRAYKDKKNFWERERLYFIKERAKDLWYGFFKRFRRCFKI
jgi:hypothetical protein